ncbi:MAG: hypothetical protein IJF01_07370 [Tidjanibacter sp.]|nr:hypothetical protein [Tidjanibacter sp.]
MDDVKWAKTRPEAKGQFVFECCWSCVHCAYDIDRQANICRQYSTSERARVIFQPHRPVNCVAWTNNPEKANYYE